MQGSLEQGRMFGPWVVAEVVGSGANGTVYRVDDSRTGGRRALKVFRNVDSRKRARIEQAVALGRILTHPNIVPATEVLDVDGQPAVLMELVEGAPLGKWLYADASEDLSSRLRVFRGIASGCAYAHAQGVVHRDLKPTNVLLQSSVSEGKTRLVPRITDFGLAKALSPEVGRFGGLTTMNTGLGTHGYAAPEQVRDASSVDARADIYSLGCLLYEMVCGIGPFAGLPAVATITAQREGRYRDPAEYVAGLPEALRQLIADMLKPEVRDRLADANQVVDVIDDVLAQLAEAVTIDLATGDQASGGRGTDVLELPTAMALCGIPTVGLLLGSAVVFVL